MTQGYVYRRTEMRESKEQKSSRFGQVSGDFEPEIEREYFVSNNYH